VVEDLFEGMVKTVTPDADADRGKIGRRNRQLARMLRRTRPLVRSHLNWEPLRTRRHSWRLDEAGYSDLIQSMLREPDKQLTFFGGLSERRGPASHPVLRKRILFIHKNFVLQR